MFLVQKIKINFVLFVAENKPTIEGAMITMECQPGGHGGHLGHSMMLDPSAGAFHQQEQETKKKSK